MTPPIVLPPLPNLGSIWNPVKNQFVNNWSDERAQAYAFAAVQADREAREPVALRIRINKPDSKWHYEDFRPIVGGDGYIEELLYR